MKNFYRLLFVAVVAVITLTNQSVNAQNVGIGTAAPAQKLEIAGTSNTIRINGLRTGGSFNTNATSSTNLLLYTNSSGDIYALPAGGIGSVLSLNATGVPTWSSANSIAWTLTGNSGTTAGTNFIGTTDAQDLQFKTGTGGVLRMTIGGTATDGGLIGINTAPATNQQLTVVTPLTNTIGVVGNNTVTTSTGTAGYGVVGESGTGAGAPYNVSITSGPVLNITAGVLGSAARGAAVPTTSGFTSNIGFGVVGLLGSAYPSSSIFLSGAGVLGATKTGGTAPFGAGVAAYSSGGGYGVYSNVTGGGIGIYTAVTGGGNTIISGAGNFGVYVLGNHSTTSGVYSYMGSKGVATLPTLASAVYATTDSTLGNVWALVANNTKSTTAPTGNGLLVFGTTNAIGTVTLGQNSTTYMTGGVTANGSLQFDNSANTNTVTINANTAATASYSLTLPPAQATAAGQVLTNDGAGNLSWTTGGGGGGGANLTGGTGITSFTYNGSTAQTVSLANTAVTPGTYGDGTDVAQFTVNAQGQLTFAGTVPITGGVLIGTAGGDLTGSYPNPTIANLQGIGVLASGVNAPTTGQVLTYNGTDWVPGNTSGTGTVTSVGLALPGSVFNVTGSPVTSSGTLTGSFANQSANTVFAGPSSGAAGAPTFRALVAADLPSLAGNYIQNQNSAAQTANFYITGNAGIGVAPVGSQQLTVSTPASANSGVVGINSVTTSTSTSGYGVVGESGSGAGVPYNVSITSGPLLNVTAGVLGSASRGAAVPTSTGTTSNIGFGVVGLLGSAYPSSTPFISGAGVLGATKSGGTAPFAAGVAAYVSGGGYGLYTNVTGGGYGIYNNTTGGGYGMYSSSTGGAFGLYESVTGSSALTATTNSVALGSGNIGVFVNGNANSLAGVYSYMGSKGYVTAPVNTSSVYAVTDSSTNKVWALSAVNTKFTTPTGNGLFVYGTTNAIGTVILGQNSTTYMTGGTAQNGSLQFDNSANTNTVTVNANTGATASYSLTLPPAQATAAGQVLTNDGAGNLSWGSASSGSVTSVGMTVPSAFSVTPSTITSSGTFAVTATGTTLQYIDGTGSLQTFPTSLAPSGAAGGDLAGTYPNPTIGSIQGFPVTASGANAPASGQVLEYNGTDWVPATPAATGVTSVSATGPLSVTNPTTTPNILLSGAAGTILYGTGAGSAFTAAGTAGQILESNGIGVPTWSSANSIAWTLTGNSGTTAGTNFIGTTDAQDLQFKTGTGGVLRMTIGGTATDGGLIGINTAPATNQQLTVVTPLTNTIGVVGNNTVTTSTGTAGYGVVGESGTGAGAPYNVSITSGPVLNITAGVLGSAARGAAVPTTSGFTSNIGFGVVGLLGSAYPSSSIFLSGAGVLGATKTGGTAPFGAGVAAYSSGGGYGVYSNVTGGGIGIYTAVTGGGNTIISGAGNFGVYVLGNHSTTSGVYSYMGSKGVATLPTLASAVYATTDSTLGNVWALVANNTKSTTAPTGNGLLVFGTTNAIGTVTLGQNSTTYMTGGVTANGSLQFDNSANTNTVTINANTAATASYSLTLPPAQATAAGQVLTNDGAGNLSWTTGGGGGGGANLTGGTGITSFTYNGSTAQTVSLANTAVTPGTYGDGTDVAQFTVNAQGQLTFAGTVPITGGVLIGTAGGDLTGSYPNPTIANLQGIGVLASGVNAPTTGQVLTYNGTDWVPGNTSGTGTVTSVGLALPGSVFNVTGSPVTSSGTLTGSFANQSANTVFAGPSSGAAGAPTFRALVAADLPSLAGNYIQNQNSAAQTANFYITGNAGIGVAPVGSQQLTVSTPASANSGVVGINSVTTSTSTSGYGVVGESGSGAGVPYNVSITSGPLLNVTAGVLGSASRGAAVPTSTGTTSNIGFGVVGLLGSAYPSSTPFISGAGVLGATKSGGTAPFAAGVAAYVSGGGYGLYTNVTGGGYGIYNNTTGGGYGMYSSSTGGAFGLYESVTGSSALTATTNSVALGSGNIGVFVNGNANSLAGVYSYMGSKGYVTAPVNTSSVYAVTDSSTNKVWALSAVNTKFTTPTGNGLFVYGTTNAIGTVILGQNSTTYMTGGTAQNGSLQFDNSANTNTVTVNANTGATASYSLTLPPAQATAAGQVLTNDGAGNLSWTTAGTGSLSNLTNGTGINAFTYNGSSAQTVSLANTTVTAGTYGSATQVPQYTVNAQGQITAASNVTITGVTPGGAAGGDLAGTYPNPTIGSIQGFPVTASGANAPTSGQVLEYNGTDWVPTTAAATGVTSVGMTVPSAFSVTPATITSTGTFAVTATGTTLQYIDGTGALQTFPTSLAPSGAAGGDLTGTYPNPTINELQGVGILASGAHAPTGGQVLEYNGTDWVPTTAAATGVTSVGLALPSIFTVSGSPVTSTGTLTGTLANESANTIFAGPASGGAAAPTFRTLVAADIPSLAGNYIQNQNSAAQTANFYITGNASIGTAPVATQQLTVSTSTTANSGIVGSNTVTAGTGVSGYGVVGEGTGGAIAYQSVIAGGATLNMNAGVFGSAAAGPAVPTSGTSNVGFGVVGMLGTTLPTSNAFPSGAGVLGTATGGGTAMGAYASGGGTGVLVLASGNGTGVNSTASGGGTGVISAATGNTGSGKGGLGVEGTASSGGTGLYGTSSGSNTQVSPLPTGGYGVFATGTSNSEAGVYGYLGSGAGTPSSTAPPAIGGVYASTNLNGATNWALVANNINVTTAPTANGLLVFGTTDEVGAVTLGANSTTYFGTGGVKANGSLIFDNSTNTNTVTLNTGVTSASYSLNLPTAQATASGQVLTNDGTGNLSWTTPSGSGSLSNLTNGTGITAFTYNGSSAATVALANTGVTAGTYGSATQVPQYTVNAQGQITAASNVTITGVTPGGAAGGDLTGTYPNPTIGSIQGFAVTASGANAPTSGQVLEYNGTDWVPSTPVATGVTSVSTTGPLSVTNPTTTPNILLSGAAGTILYGTGTGSAFSSTGTTGQLLQSTGTGAPTWASANNLTWTLTGNNGTTAGTNFIGTTDGQDLVFKTNATEHMRIDNTNGFIGIGTTLPTQPLTVDDTSNLNKYVISAAAVQTSLSTDYQNVGVYGYAQGGNDNFGYAIGVMGVIHPISHAGIALYGGINTTAPTLTPANNTYYGIYTDASGVTIGTAYAAAFMNGNVGVGTATPAQALDIVGNVKFSQALMPNGLAGTPGQVLQSNGGGAAPTWVNAATGTVTSVGMTVPSAFSVTPATITSAGTFAVTATGTTLQYIDGTGALQTFPTSLAPSGTAGGDLTGTYPNPIINKLQGIGVTASGANTPSSGQVLGYNGTNWLPVTPTLGTVTSVGLSVPGSSIFGVTGSPVTSTGTLGLTTTGTNGGIPYFSSASTLASSAALTQDGIVYGGGAGTAPATTAAGSTGQILQSKGGAGIAPSWTTATYPSTTTANQVLYSSSNNTVAGLATANSAVLTTSSTGVPSWTNTSVTGATAGGVLNNIQVITSGSTYTPTPGTNLAVVELIGGGGGGGSTTAPATNGSAGGGGGAGGYIKFFLPNPASGGYTISIGSGGAGGTAGSNGTGGNATTFQLSGTVTYTAGGGGGGAEGNASNAVGGGTGGSNTISGSGTALINVSGTPGGIGVGTGQKAAASGPGGSSYLGGGGASVALTNTGGPTTGNPGATNSGSGGSGGCVVGGAAATGGAGGSGVIIVTEYK